METRATRATRTPIDTPVEQSMITPNEPLQEAPLITQEFVPASTVNNDPWSSFANSGSDIEVETARAGEELLAYVDKQIQRMNSKVTFSGNGNITLYELDVALSTYEPTLFALTALYEQARFDSEVAKEKYDEWYYDKYMEIRNTYNTKDVKNAQWLSAKEIDATLFKIYRKDAAKLKAEKIKAEGQRSTIERLLRGWENYAYILGQLSKNVNAQMMGSSMSVDLARGDDKFN